jgi:hypothetical protein
MAKALTKKNLMDELESELTVCFNNLANAVVKDLTSDSTKGGYSPVLTGFVASSWKASSSPVSYNENVYGYSPWNALKIKAIKKQPFTPKIEQRHQIPKFTLKQTMYIANTANYIPYAFASGKNKVPHYIHGGALAKTVDRIFTDKKGALTQGTTVPDIQ